MTTSDTTLAALTGQFNQAAAHLPTLFDLAESELQLLSDLEAAYTAEPPSPSDPRYETALAEQQEAVARLSAQFVGNEALVIRKIEGYLGLMAHLRMLSEARKAQSDRLAAKAKTTQRGEEWLRERLLAAMKVMGRDRIETPIGTVRIQQNPLKVEVLEPAMVPSEYTRTTIKVDVDKIAIRKHFESTGELVPGVEVTRGESLRVS